MYSEHHSPQTCRTPSPSPTPTVTPTRLDLSSLPPIAVLSAHLNAEEERLFGETLRRYGAPLTTDVSRAKVFFGKVGTKRRAEFELRSRKIVAEEAANPKRPANLGRADIHARKRHKSAPKPLVSTNEKDSTTEEEEISNGPSQGKALAREQRTQLSSSLTSGLVTDTTPIFDTSSNNDLVWVVKLSWLQACVSKGHLIPLGEHLVYKGKVLDRPKSQNTKSIPSIFSPTALVTPASKTPLENRTHDVQGILDHVPLNVSKSSPQTTYQPLRFGNRESRHFDGRSFTSSAPRSYVPQTANLLQKTTSEYEGEDSEFPAPPDWVTKGVKYACQRFTPSNSPNRSFIEQLKKIRKARTLIDDSIGVRAYSTMIASIAAYPYQLSHPRELAQLPGCDEKTAVLFVEWKNSGKIQAVEDYDNDEAMKVLCLFYDIWGVGAKTARHFYYNNHWTELDDIIEFGWNDLDRVQQIGVKYYEEFLVPIPRLEVEHIASIVKEHAVRLRDDRVTLTIVGGYRRGKAASGDVDLIVSHPDLESTAGLIQEMVASLDESGWISHTLTMSLANTNRGQQALPFRSAQGARVGFDTLDKALVVWQDPNWPTRAHDLAQDPTAKNPAVHRRVDMIVAPWRTVGCAVMGWSGGTTFQRDLRRYAKAVKGWKFDSSGIRSRSTGEVVLLEGQHGVSGTPEDAEKRVFEGLGLEFVPPEYRVTY